MQLACHSIVDIAGKKHPQLFTNVTDDLKVPWRVFLKVEMTAKLFQNTAYQMLTAVSALAMDKLKHNPDVTLFFGDVICPQKTGMAPACEVQQLWSKWQILLTSGLPGSRLVVDNPPFTDFDFVNKPYYYRWYRQIAAAAKAIN
jgi:hypothetical protein